MTEVVKDGPSTRALKHLNNRNNLADLRLRKTLEQFDREKSFSIAHMDRDRFDTRDFLKNVKYCDSDYLPQSRTFLGSPSLRRRSKTARTAPGRIVRESQDTTDFSDTDDDDSSESRDILANPATMKARLLASRKTTKPRKITDFQRAERFLRRLREQVAVEELQSHYADANYEDFLNAAVTKISRNITPSIYTPSITCPNGPTACHSAVKRSHGHGGVVLKSDKPDSATARFDMVYPIRLLGNFETKYEPRTQTPSPSLGAGSPGIRCTPMGLPEGGAQGLSYRLLATAPQPLKPWTTCSLDALSTKPQSELNYDIMRAMLRSGFKKKSLDQRVQDFCQELDEIRERGSKILPSRPLEGK